MWFKRGPSALATSGEFCTFTQLLRFLSPCRSWNCSTRPLAQKWCKGTDGSKKLLQDHLYTDCITILQTLSHMHHFFCGDLMCSLNKMQHKTWQSYFPMEKNKAILSNTFILLEIPLNCSKSLEGWLFLLNSIGCWTSFFRTFNISLNLSDLTSIQFCKYWKTAICKYAFEDYIYHKPNQEYLKVTFNSMHAIVNL